MISNIMPHLNIDVEGTHKFSILRQPRCASTGIRALGKFLGLTNSVGTWTKLLVPVRDWEEQWIGGAKMEFYQNMDTTFHPHPQQQWTLTETREVFQRTLKKHPTFLYTDHADLYRFMNNIVEFCLLDDVWFCYLNDMNKLEFWEWVEEISDWGLAKDMFDEWLICSARNDYPKIRDSIAVNVEECVREQLNREPIIQLVLERHQSILNNNLQKSRKWLKF